MKEQVYGPDEIIVKKGSYEEPRIYIIMKGEVELFVEVGTSKSLNQTETYKKIKTLADS